MTPRQSEALDFITRYIGDHGYSPSYREIADALGFANVSGPHRVVHGLLQRGYLKREHSRSKNRNLVLANDSPLASVPTATLIEELNRRGVRDPRHG